MSMSRLLDRSISRQKSNKSEKEQQNHHARVRIRGIKKKNHRKKNPQYLEWEERGGANRKKGNGERVRRTPDNDGDEERATRTAPVRVEVEFDIERR